jgi:hypothetical protein
VVVVALRVDEALALQPLAQQVEQTARGGQAVRDLSEQEVEQVAQEDDLIDVQMRLEQREPLRLAQQVLARPRTEVRVRDHQRTHRSPPWLGCVLSRMPANRQVPTAALSSGHAS